MSLILYIIGGIMAAIICFNYRQSMVKEDSLYTKEEKREINKTEDFFISVFVGLIGYFGLFIVSMTIIINYIFKRCGEN